MSVDARHDGQLAVDIETAVEARGPIPAELRVQVETLGGDPVGDPLTASIEPNRRTRVEGSIDGIEPWSAEFPNLYRLRVELVDTGGGILHRRFARIGFRTVRFYQTLLI